VGRIFSKEIAYFICIIMTLKSIRYESGKLEILDQLSLPAHSQYIEVKGVEDGWRAIHKMHVSGIFTFQITYFIFDTRVRRVIVFIISLTNIPLLW
jgi:hypothetical protein